MEECIPLSNEKEEIIAAKLKVYAGDSEEYYAFISPEAFYSLKEWMDFRCSYGEKINGDLIYTITNLNLILTH